MDISKLKKGIDNRKKITWPGSDLAIYLRVLCEGDYLKAEERCDALYKERGVNLGNIEERSAAKDTYCLYLAIVDEDGKRVFPDFETFTTYLTPEIRTELVQTQNDWQSECSPHIEKLSEKEMDDLLESIKKNHGTVRNISDMRLLRELIITMVSRQKKLPTASSSTL